MVQCRTFAVSILSNDKPIPTYEQPIDRTPDKVVCYLETTPNTKFEIQLTLLPGSAVKECDSLCFDIFMDGEFLIGRTAPPVACRTGRPATDTVRGLKSQDAKGNWLLHPFEFGAMNIVEGNGALNRDELEATYGKAGSIQVVVRRYKRVGLSKISESYRKLESEDQAVPEKGVKKSAANMVAKLATPVPTLSNACHAGKAVGTPIATFMFLYRTRAALQMLSIIPHDTIPPRLEDKPIQDLTIPEMQELIHRHRAINSMAQRIKEEEKEDKHERARALRHQATLRSLRQQPIESISRVGRIKARKPKAGMKRKIEVVELSDDE